jgi:hypothetical protein
MEQINKAWAWVKANKKISIIAVVVVVVIYSLVN